MRKNIYRLLLPMLILFSCKTKQKPSELNYMQNIEKIAIKSVEQESIATLQVGDELVILITGRDNNVLNPFNQNYASSEPIRNASAGNIITNQERISGPTYIVDNQGNIDFPILGMIDAQGKTIEALREIIKNRLTKYVKTPTSVNIRLTNFEISVFGEVNKANKYRVNSEKKPTVLDALALAGDLTIYGKRDDVLVIRNENGNIVKGRINLKDADFMNSPFYYLKQGDAILVSANENKEKQARINPNRTFYITLASVTLTAIAIILSLRK